MGAAGHRRVIGGVQVDRFRREQVSYTTLYASGEA
jgi:hypothetical protein